MQRISTLTKAIDLFGLGKHGFKNGDLATGILPTDLDAAWFNGLQEEVVAVIEAAGIAPSGASLTQLLLALRSSGVFQTPTQFDSSTKAATTAFVQAAGFHFKNVSPIAIPGNIVLTPAQAGHWAEVTGTGVTVTLPALTAGSYLSSYTIKAVKTFTLQGAGADVISRGVSAASNTYVVLAGQTITVTQNDVTGWYAVAEGFGSSNFAGTLGTSGSQLFPGGLIWKWGVVNVPISAISTVTLPTAFPNNFFVAFATCQQASLNAAATPSFAAEPTGLTQVKVQNCYTGSSLNIAWHALGN